MIVPREKEILLDQFESTMSNEQGKVNKSSSHVHGKHSRNDPKLRQKQGENITSGVGGESASQACQLSLQHSLH